MPAHAAKPNLLVVPALHVVPMDVPVGPAVAQAEGIDDEASSDDSDVANLCCFIDY